MQLDGTSDRFGSTAAVPWRSRDWQESVHPRHCRTLRRRSPDRTDSGPLALGAEKRFETDYFSFLKLIGEVHSDEHRRAIPSI